MKVRVFDSFVDAAGTEIIAHTSEAGGPVVASGTTPSAQITDANRLRGNSANGTFTWTTPPSGLNWTLEITLFVATKVGSIQFKVSGYTFGYNSSGDVWTLSGGTLINGPVAAITLTAGQRYKLELSSSDGNLLATVDGNHLVSGSDSAQPAPASFGVVFSQQDTNSTGLQLESVVLFESLTAAVTQTVASMTVRDPEGNVVTDPTTYTFQLIDPQASGDGWDTTPFEVTSDTDGLIEVVLKQSAQYRAHSPHGDWVSFTTGSAGTYTIPQIPGRL